MLLWPNYTAGGSGIYVAQEITSLGIPLVIALFESIRFVKRRISSAASGCSESHGEYGMGILACIYWTRVEEVDLRCSSETGGIQAVGEKVNTQIDHDCRTSALRPPRHRCAACCVLRAACCVVFMIPY